MTERRALEAAPDQQVDVAGRARHAFAMRRHAAVLGICVTAWSGAARADTPGPAPAPPGIESAPGPAPAPAPGPAAATSGTPGADRIQFAAREHDLGYRAYLEKQYDEAASHFENAFFAAPNPAELRSAIRARRDAGELARAATLAAIGQRRFPGDPATGKVAADVIAQAKGQVYEVQISSSAEYSVAIDEKIVSAERAKDSRLFVSPGTHQLLVSWSDDRNTRISIDAREGGSQSLQLEPPATQAPIAPVVPPPVTPPPTPAVVAPPPSVPPPPPSKPFGPAVFITGAALTAVGAGLIVWSGVEAENNPGTDAVRQACIAGWSGNCPSVYSRGASAEARTNIIIGLTAGVGAATAVVGLFFTQWSSPATASTGGGHPVPPAAVLVAPFVGWREAGVEGTF